VSRFVNKIFAPVLTPKPHYSKFMSTSENIHKIIVDINDTKHRYYLGREETHKEMEQFFKVKFSTLGKYYPNRKMATEGAPPLQLHISAASQEDLDKTVAWVNEVKEKGPQSVKKPSSTGVIGAGIVGSERLEKRLFIPFDYTETHLFALRNAILGPQGNYLKFIATQSGASVSLRGRSSGSILTQEDKQHPFHIFVVAMTERQMNDAEAMIKDLYVVLQFEYEISKQLGYFTPLGGMFAPDHVLVQYEKGQQPQSSQPGAIMTGGPAYYQQLYPQHFQDLGMSYASAVQHQQSQQNSIKKEK
jgi:hypothetical protein